MRQRSRYEVGDDCSTLAWARWVAFGIEHHLAVGEHGVVAPRTISRALTYWSWRRPVTR
jgi:hypothetical protein